MTRSQSSSDKHRSRSGSRDKNNKKEEARDQNIGQCLYIGNIDKRITQQKLESTFREFGPMEYCNIVYQPHSSSDRQSKPEVKQSRGYGFAKFVNHEDSVRAQEKLHGSDLNGRRLNVEFSKRGKPRDATPGRYLGKKKPSPPRHTSRRSRRSYSRSSSESYRHRRKYEDKRSSKYDRSRSRSRSEDKHRRRRGRDSYSRSPPRR